MAYGLWICPQPWLAVVWGGGGIGIALSCVQSACGMAHGGKSPLSFPLLSKIVTISPGEANIWMSLATKLRSKPVLTHWDELCHSSLKIGESIPTWTGSWKTYLWLSLLHELSCKLSRTNYPLHLWTANNSSPNACQLLPTPLGIVPLQIFHLQRRHWTRSRDSATANVWLCVVLSCSERMWTRLSLRSLKPSCTHTL